MLAAGTTAPDFSLPDDERRVRTLGEFLAAGPLVLYFYPADFTPGCTAEACMFRDAHAELAEQGVQVVGVSPQSAGTHAKFKKRFRIPFPLLADEQKAAIRAYDAMGPMGLLTRRVTYFIEPSGVIADAVLADLNIKRHARFIERAVKSRPSAPGADPDA